MRERMVAARDAANHTSIDDYVLSSEVGFIRNNFTKFIALESPSTKLFRYEDVIFEKETWVKLIAEWLSIEVGGDSIAKIARRHDIRPGDENPDRHVRQVTPGNYQKHLAPSTIAKLNEQYFDVIKHFHYETLEIL